MKKFRPETVEERIERMHHMYDGGPKPKHFDDKSIVDMEKWNSMKGLEKKTPVVKKPTNRSIQDQVIDYSPNKIQRPKPFRFQKVCHNIAHNVFHKVFHKVVPNAIHKVFHVHMFTSRFSRPNFH